MVEDELFFEELNRLANILQVINFVLNVQDASNTTILKELNHQNKDFLETIIKMLNTLQERQNVIDEKLNKILTKLNDNVDELNENLETLNDDKK